jgi:asparagine synthase (glutamine-hydrolysing)
MCGIAGIIRKDNKGNGAILAMLQAQQHRGPDAQKVWAGESVFLGHNRLGIIDLSSHANQPMHSACGRYVLVFNGEIYNYLELKVELKDYPFSTLSDSEVLLAGYIQWGEAVLDRLNGMFAFMIWDRQTQSAFMARDRFGVKPFYYAIHADGFYFASEIKALWAGGVSKEKNNSVWASYLVHASYGLPHQTFWEGIFQLAGGHSMRLQVTDGEVVLQAPLLWYDFVTRIKEQPALSLEALKTTYKAILQEAIALRFRADVPVGMNVSGGLDSSTLIAMVHQHLGPQSNLDAFTFYCNDDRYDELPWVQDLLDDRNYPLHPVLLQAKAVPAAIEEVARIQDEPFGGFPTLAYSLLFQEARKKGILVLLDGQGMDEAWGGYDYYYQQNNHVIQGLNSSPVRPEVLTDAFRALATREEYPKPFESELQNKQYRDLFYTKIPRALRFNDRISMMHSTELREPFLDYRLVELAFAQTDDLKQQNGQTKWLLRELVKETLGDSIALAPKRALQTPQREWMSGELQGYVSQCVTEFGQLDFVSAERVQEVWQTYVNGDQDNSFYLWQWINLVAIEKGSR